MPVFVGLLRAVNLGPHNKVSMSDLRELLSLLGLKDGQTLLQSGNVVFRSKVTSAATLERVLQDGAEQHLNLSTQFFVRSVAEWQQIIAANPFPREAERDPSHLLMLCLKDAVSANTVKALQDAIPAREVVKAKDAAREAYIVYPDGIGTSRLTSMVIEKKLGTRSTARNWNTVLKLGALAESTSR